MISTIFNLSFLLISYSAIHINIRYIIPATIASPSVIHKGANTHIHFQVITLQSFNTMKTIVSTHGNVIPLPATDSLLIIYSLWNRIHLFLLHSYVASLYNHKLVHILSVLHVYLLVMQFVCLRYCTTVHVFPFQNSQNL